MGEEREPGPHRGNRPGKDESRENEMNNLRRKDAAFTRVFCGK